MTWRRKHFDSLGVKVRRAQLALERARGVGEVNGVRVVVDANCHLVAVSVQDEEALLAAYRAALQDLAPQLDEAMREVRADSRFTSVSARTEVDSARLEAERRQCAEEYFDSVRPYGLEGLW
ncbi:hypothetical protein [Nocardia terpenica]|uniref:Uncharacterized protein n=1 Tax=Nocardia terpenica TaxID=455432 RepID=A0A164JLI7_9NOCA|nr:hypothetical protein [Nocardia terpenica]ATL70625.1 hypothetical protein CRH09_35090 [Nocardia terpenica]KZM70517.1 hypothetical protein AWN90_38670 [Nocardia terpenica]NQE90247.1 hypothetical protein [Nocardia terpenica]